MAAALVVSGGASVWTAWQKTPAGFPTGRLAIVTFAVLVVLGHVYARKRRRPK